MKITNFKIYPVRIPFSFPINHHLKNRASSSSVVLAVNTDDGRTGYGEGAPREYVTGESLLEVTNALETALIYCTNRVIDTLQDIENLCLELYQKYQLPSMVSAIEIALLDLLGQAKNCSIAQFLIPQNVFETNAEQDNFVLLPVGIH